jgi:hypothetical protein
VQKDHFLSASEIDEVSLREQELLRSFGVISALLQ